MNFEELKIKNKKKQLIIENNIIKFCTKSAKKPIEISKFLKIPLNTLRVYIYKMVKKGKLEKIKYANYKKAQKNS